LAAAAALARAGEAQVRVIHVFRPEAAAPPALMVSPVYLQVAEEAEAAEREQLARAVQELTARSITADGIFVVGSPVPELVTQSEDLDLLVTGSRGYGPLRAVLLGGVTGRLASLARCPLLVVPRGAGASLETPLSASSARAAS
jgi:nucleotide-binding universal stress UspA family protein